MLHTIKKAPNLRYPADETLRVSRLKSNVKLKNIMTIYGNHKLNGKFEKIIELHDNGFIFDNKEYKWNDIKKIKRYDSIFWNLLFYQGGTPRAYICLKDGKCIKLRGRILQQKNEDLSINSIKGTSNAYKELIEFLTNKIKNTT